MCVIEIIKLYSDGISITIEGTVQDECDNIHLEVRNDSGGIHIDTDISVPQGSTNSPQSWIYTAGFDSQVISANCKNSNFRIDAYCDDNLCATTSILPLSCCPIFNITNLGADNSCVQGPFGQSRALTGIVHIDRADDIEDELIFEIRMWVQGFPEFPVVDTFALASGQTTYTAGTDFNLNLIAPGTWEGSLSLLTPTRCIQTILINPLTIAQCSCDTPPPPDSLFEVTNPDGTIVNDPNDTGCVNGDYALVNADNWQGNISWTAWQDSTEQNISFPVANNERMIQVSLPQDGSRITVNALVGLPGCETTVGVSIKKCGVEPEPACTPVPGDYSLVVRDDNENIIEEGRCVPSDIAWVTAPDFEGARSWTVDDNSADSFAETDNLLRINLNNNNAREVEALVGSGGCQTSINRTIRRCRNQLPEPVEEPPRGLCMLFMFLLVFGIGIVALGVVLLCPGITSIPPIEQYTLAVSVIMGGFLISIISLALWYFICKPSKCGWILLGAKLSFVVGLIFTYATFCPGCAWFGFGFIGFFLFLFLFYMWTQECRPTICTAYIELFLLTLAFDFIWIIELILASCVITSSPAEAAVFGFTLFLFTSWVTFNLFRFNCLDESR